MRQLPQTNFDNVLSKIYESNIYNKPISRESGLAKIKQLISGEGEMDIDDFINSVAEEIGIEMTLSPNGNTVEYYGTGIPEEDPESETRLAPPGPMRPRPIPSSWSEDQEKPNAIPLSPIFRKPEAIPLSRETPQPNAIPLSPIFRKPERNFRSLRRSLRNT